MFPLLEEEVGAAGILLLASLTSLLGAVFSFCALPSTRNKSIYQLEILFRQGYQKPGS